MLNQSPATLEERKQFRHILPEIQGRLKSRLHSILDKDEIVAIAVAFAFLIFLSSKRKGKEVTPGNIAFYASGLALSGRQVIPCTSMDAYTRNEHRRPVSIEQFEFEKMLTSGCGNIPDTVAFKLDWENFLADKPQRDIDIVGLLAQGYRRSEVARVVGVSRGRVTQLMDKLKEDWQEYTAYCQA